MSRRGVLGLFGAVGAGVVVRAFTAGPGHAATVYAGEPVITGTVRITGTWTVDGLTVPAGAVLEFDPDSSVTLQSRGNVVVEGTLRMRPASSAQTHRLQFIEVNEAAMVGGGMTVLASDVGLWVTGAGVLDAQGTAKAGWNRTGTDSTWVVGDEVRTAPQALKDFSTFAPFTPGSPVPTVTNQGVGYPTEVFNLTRNVIIGGTPGGRSHVLFLHGHDTAQTLKWVRFEHVGPRKPGTIAGKTELVAGRYGLHLHHGGDGTRGSLVEGCVVTACGNRAFVAHASHGVTFRDCVSFDSHEEAYWWDPDNQTYPVNASFDTTYEHCAGFLVGGQPDRPAGDTTLAVFELQEGTGNAAIDCVAVGNRNGNSASGYQWPEHVGAKPGSWVFRDCVAHNNKAVGIYAWENNPWMTTTHLIESFTSYRNGIGGVGHGAYINDFHYDGVVSFGNGAFVPASALQFGISTSQHNTFTDMVLDGEGLSTYALRFNPAKANGDPANPLVVLRADLRGYKTKPVAVENFNNWVTLDFVECTVAGVRDLEPGDFAIVKSNPASVYRVQRRDGTAYRLHPSGSSSSIPAFAA